jgi:hypothetical protein
LLILFLCVFLTIDKELHAEDSVVFTATELLGRPTNNSITVNLLSEQDLEVYFVYGTEQGNYTGTTNVTEFIGGDPIEVVIGDLKSNTSYHYRMFYREVGTTNWIAGDEHSFQTQRAQESTFKFTITSDSHVNILLGSAAMWQRTMTNVANDNPDFEIDLGDTFAMDNVNNAVGAEQAYLYQRQFFDIAGHSAPIFLGIGNHEQQEAWHLDDTGNPATSLPVLGVNAQKKYYLNPIPDAFYLGNTDNTSSPYISDNGLLEDYYSWTWGNALFVVLDPFWYTTTKPYIGNIGGGESSDAGSGNRWDWTLGLQQFNWLKQTLEESNASCKFIFAHHMTGGADDYGGRGGAVPAHLVEWGGYNEAGIIWGWDANRPMAQWGSKPVHQLLVDNQVSAFFFGHDHQYAYEKRDEVVYQSLPAAGFSGNGFNSYSEGGYTLKVLSSPGHLRVTVSPSQVTVDYIQASLSGGSNGQVAYSYTIPANIIPNPPSNLTATAISGTQINLSWTDNSSAEFDYMIERKMGASGFYSHIASTNNTNYSDSGLSPNTTYYYRVKTYNAFGNSTYSNEASATTASPSPSPTQSPESTSSPSPTPSLSPSLAPTSTPSPSHSSEPTPTSTPTPTSAPQSSEEQPLSIYAITVATAFVILGSAILMIRKRRQQ